MKKVSESRHLEMFLDTYKTILESKIPGGGELPDWEDFEDECYFILFKRNKPQCFIEFFDDSIMGRCEEYELFLSLE